MKVAPNRNQIASSRAIKEIKKELKKRPFDAAHDLNHHQAVVRNIPKIITSLGRPKVDSLALTTAGWFHDVGRDEAPLQPKCSLEII